MKELYFPTGNEYVSIPTLREETAAIESFSCLHMGAKGLVEFRGDGSAPVMAPFVRSGGASLPLTDMVWQRLEYWVPEFTARAGDLNVRGTILAPVGERGFIYRLSVENASGAPVDAAYGLEGTWASAWLCVNEDKEILGTKRVTDSLWNSGPVFEFFCALPFLAFAPMCDLDTVSSHSERGGAVDYALERRVTLAPGESEAACFYWGLGYEEVAAATSAKEMLRQGWSHELEATLGYLRSRSWHTDDAQLRTLYNTNLFFCIFYSTGLTIDTEELVLVTSRSPRYYVSAAYWDRDSLFWSFPSAVDADLALAREMLLYAFGRQGRNIGVHSRFIDGTVLEPGFELDELMAPILALERYVSASGDRSVPELPCVRQGVERILRTLETKRHASVALYETFLMPTDDLRTYPYLTYDNVLVWRALRALSRLYPERFAALAAEAEKVREAIFEHCTAEGAQGRYFVWSTDLNGSSDVYDEPPGSLLLLPYLGFCESDCPEYVNTARMIRSPDYAYSFAGCEFADIGCAHAPHPWLPSIANSLLSGEEARAEDILRRAFMDNGIVCESIDEHTGECATGAHFATAAGFVCHALRRALGGVYYEE